MAGLILACIIIISTIIFSSIPIEGAILISSKLLFWWYLILSLPKIAFALFVLGMILFVSSAATANAIAKSTIGKIFGFGTLMMAGGGMVAIFATLTLAANIFLIGGAYLISTSIDVNPFIGLGENYEYNYVRLIIGVLAIFIGIWLKRKSKLKVASPPKQSK